MNTTQSSPFPSYRSFTAWRAYGRYYAPHLRDEPTEEWWAWRGMDVHLDRIVVPDAPVKLISFHGAGSYGRGLAPLLVAAARAGFEAVAPDLPGYGLTRTNGQVVDYPMWVDCAADLIEAERARDGRPIAVVGLSMGGLLAYSAVARTGAAGLVVSCLLDPREAGVRARLARYGWMGRLGASALPKALDRVRVPIRWLSNMPAISNNPALVEECMTDRHGGGGRVPLRFLRTYLSSSPTVEPEEFRTCPVLLVHPAADRWTPVSITKPFFDRIAAPKRLVMLENAGHFPIEQPGVAQLEGAMRTFLDEITPV